MALSPRSLSVVIPAYNEESGIEACVRALETVLKDLCETFEIIVVNDGSTDRTAAILEALKQSRAYLVVVHHERNHGLGQTLRSGFNRCRNEVTFYSDADLPFDFFELGRALRVMTLKNADLVVGFRHDRTDEGIRRIVYSFAYNWLIRLLFGLRIRDVNFSFKLIRTSALRRMNLKSEGSFIDAEMLIKADRMGLFICQIGVDYFKRRFGNSNLSSLRTIAKIFREMVREYPTLIRTSKES
ncbi:MAG: glycosyltransferase family 2 protein [Acidobacteriia bacterium]|nr:glycosyltransferase family 2 protein [Terriglobia bacterium]